MHPTHWLISTQVLTALKSTGKAKAPRYDKTAFGGFGDRAGLVDVEGADVVLVEGWMAGFKPVGAAAATAVDADLGAVDACLGAYARWDAHADAWLVVAIESPADTVYGWRREAERRAGGGLSDEQVRDFVGRFLPSYEAYCPALYEAAAGGGQTHAPAVALEDGHAHPVLQMPHPSRDRRLRQPQRIRGGAKSAMAGNGADDGKVAEAEHFRDMRPWATPSQARPRLTRQRPRPICAAAQHEVRAMSQIPHPPDFGPPRIRLRGLEGRDRHDHAAHLLRLSPEDRRARFHAALTDDAIRAYSDGVDWDHALIFGAFVGGVLRGLGELIPWPARDQGEASFSIEQPFQQIGLGKRLVLATVLATALAMARNELLSLTSLPSFGALLAGNPTPFALKYTLGSLLSMGASGFLVGPAKQCEGMCAPVRRFASLLYVASLCATLFCIFRLHDRLLTSVAMCLQLAAMVWYCLTYVPFGGVLLRRCLGLVCKT